MDLTGRKKSKNVEDLSRPRGDRPMKAAMLDVALDTQRRGHPLAKRERTPMPNWYQKEVYGYKRPDQKAYNNRYWKGPHK